MTGIRTLLGSFFLYCIYTLCIASKIGFPNPDMPCRTSTRQLVQTSSATAVLSYISCSALQSVYKASDTNISADYEATAKEEVL